MLNLIKQEDVMLSEKERIKAYRQMQSSIRNSEKYLIVGIDIAKKKDVAFFGTATGKTVCKQLVFGNDRKGFEELEARAEQLRLKHRLTQVVFGMEPTANYHKPLAEYLIQRDAMVVQVLGNAVVHNRQLLDNRWDKHDRKDAANIADLISSGKCLYYDYPAQAIHDLRELLSLRRRYRKLEAGLRTRIRNNLLALYFPELDSRFASCQSDCLDIIKSCFSPALIAAMPFEEFYRRFFKPRRKKQKEFLEQIWNDAHVTIGRPVDETVQFMAEQAVTQLEQFRTEIAHLDRQINNIAAAIPVYQYVMSIPGFGPFITAKTIAAIDDPERFSNEAQLIKLAGFDLCASRSGEPSGKAIPKISKKGNSELRFALFQAAMVATTKKSLFIRYMNQKLQGRELEKGIKKKVRTKVACKLLVIAWTLMKEHQYFNAERLMLT